MEKGKKQEGPASLLSSISAKQPDHACARAKETKRFRGWSARNLQSCMSCSRKLEMDSSTEDIHDPNAILHVMQQDLLAQ